MIQLLTILMVIAMILFILSFFLPDPLKELRDEVDRLSLEWHQEMYSLRKRLKLIEEELLIVPEQAEMESKKLNQIIINQVRLLHKQGLPIEKIAKLSALEREDVIKIIRNLKRQGELNE